MSWEIVPFESLKGKTFKNIIINKTKDSISFITDDNKWYIMNHKQECCEHVFIKEIDNDIQSLVGSEILLAECRINESTLKPGDEFYDDNYSDQTWSFYTLRTINNTCTISWYGVSNGFYSETVDLMLHVNEKEYEIQSLTNCFSDRTEYSESDNQLLDKFLEMVKSIPEDLHWYSIKHQNEDTDKIRSINFAIVNPNMDLIEYKLYFDDECSLKIDRIQHFDDLSIENVVDKDITWPDVEFIEEFLYKYGRFE